MQKMSNLEICQLSVTELVKKTTSGEISVREVILAYLEQIEKFNPMINALIFVKDRQQLLSQAEKLDRMRENSQDLGPLFGVPFTVKDIFETQDDPLTAGCLALKENKGKKDATFVTRLKNAGAILIGKTNTPEFENSADTINLLYGATKNPYNLEKSAGGSSGGCGAAVAACLAAFSIGADHGGSLRIPAHYNGVVTIRSTVGRIPSTGVLYGLRTGPGACFNTEGPIARKVADLDLIMRVIQGPDYIDPNTISMSWPDKSKIKIDNLKCAFFYDDGNSLVQQEVQNAVTQAAEALKSSGATINHEAPAKIGEGYKLYQKISGPIATEGFTSLFKQYQVTTPSPLIKQQIENFKSYDTGDAIEFLRRSGELDKFRSEILQFFMTYNLFICPVTSQEALPLNTPMWFGLVHLLSFCWDTSAARLPAVVVRAGTSASGMPIGVQIVGAPGHEDILLAAAEEIENKLGGWRYFTMGK